MFEDVGIKACKLLVIQDMVPHGVMCEVSKEVAIG